MHIFVLTGAPGAGKTAVLRELAADYPVIDEAATDVIALEQARGCAEPWLQPEFIDKIVTLQRARQERCAVACGDAGTAIADRSPVCTLALARFLGHPVPPLLAAELDRIRVARTYRPEVFFVRGLGFVTPTAARRISQADALAFEQAHEHAYREQGFRLIDVPAVSVADRAALVRRMVGETVSAEVAGAGVAGAEVAPRRAAMGWPGERTR